MQKPFTHRVECTDWRYGQTSFGMGYSKSEALRALLCHAEHSFKLDTLRAFPLDGNGDKLDECSITVDPEARREWVEEVAEQLESEAATLRESLLQPEGGQ